MGGLLSLALFAVMGIRPVFLRDQLYDVGDGGIILPSKWRLLGPIESILGILMCGLSVSLLFAIATRLVGNER
jgi:hypothetical protein